MPSSHNNRVSSWDEIEDSALVQLVYVSSLTLVSRLSASIFDEVECHARNYNQQHGITGTLCYGSGHFLQCIEGEKAHVFALKQRIFADKRHKNTEILLLQTIEHRRCGLAYALIIFRALVMVTSEQKASRTVIAIFAICAA